MVIVYPGLLSEAVVDGSWVERVLVSLVLCLRDWLVSLPIPAMMSQGGLDTATLQTVFEVSCVNTCVYVIV